MASSRLLTNKVMFVLRRTFAAYRLPSILAFVSLSLLIAAFGYRVTSEAALQAARAEALQLFDGLDSPSIQRPRNAATKVRLKVFQSSHLLAILEQGASSANIKLDEISFVIDDSPNQPYVRYRATFTVLSRYPTIRKFISAILAGSEGVVLDTVACRREDVTAADVRCDISAYVAYQEKAGG